MKKIQNYCFNEYTSCSACCGIYNLAFSPKELESWLLENTKIFLSLSLKNPREIYAYRKLREEKIEPYRIDKEVYVCPFVGYVESKKTGCLLHPQGSPHPEISLWENPQNFSFYGASICQNYNCVAKERRLADIFCDILPEEIYGRIVCRADILSYLKYIKNQNPDFSLKIWIKENFSKIQKLNSHSFENLPVPEKSLNPQKDLESLFAKDRHAIS